MNTKMNKLAVTLASVMALGGFGANAYAAADNSTTTSTVITPITIVAGAPLAFGSFAPGVGGTVTIANDGTRSGSGVILSATSAGGVAAFNVGGEASTGYAITHSGTSVLTGISGAALALPSTMALAKTSNYTITGGAASSTLSALGTDVINVGGTLTVAANQPAGIYNGNVVVTVEYN